MYFQEEKCLFRVSSLKHIPQMWRLIVRRSSQCCSWRWGSVNSVVLWALHYLLFQIELVVPLAAPFTGVGASGDCGASAGNSTPPSSFLLSALALQLSFSKDIVGVLAPGTSTFLLQWVHPLAIWHGVADNPLSSISPALAAHRQPQNRPNRSCATGSSHLKGVEFGRPFRATNLRPWFFQGAPALSTTNSVYAGSIDARAVRPTPSSSTRPPS